MAVTKDGSGPKVTVPRQLVHFGVGGKFDPEQICISIIGRRIEYSKTYPTAFKLPMAATPPFSVLGMPAQWTCISAG